MMKKLRIIALLFILTFSFSVKAEVFMEIDCNSKDVNNKNKITCEGNLIYEEVSIDDIDLEYTTNLDIDFISLPGFNLSKSGNKISIHSNTPLYDEILNSTVIMKFTLKANDNSNERESLAFKNIKINKSNSELIDDVSETFNVSIDKVLDNDCFLNNITIDSVSIAGFDKNKLEYRGIVVNKDVVFIDAVRSSEKSSATGLGEVFIKKGETLERDIEVVAEDNSKKVYKLFITNQSEDVSVGDVNSVGLELSKDNTLKSIELFNGKEKIPFTFSNKKDVFDIVINDSNLKKITIKATTNDNKATFIDKFGPRDVNVSLGDNQILIKVQAENKEEKTYTLNISLKESKNNDNTLSSLTINDEIIKLVEGINNYEIILPKDVSKTKINATPTDEMATVEFKDIELKDGNNEVVINVTAQNGDKREYHISINRSDKNVLKDLKIDGYNLGFSSKETDYVLKINNDDNELKIIVNPSNVNYEVFDNEDLTNGSIVRIRVDDANGIKEYKITILKDSDKISIYIYIAIIVLAIVIAISIIYLIRRKRKNDLDIDVI